MAAEEKTGWRIDKHIPIASLAALFVQTLVLVAWLSAFYTNTTNNQIKNEERFSSMADQRKVTDLKFESMQATQTQILTQLASLTEKQNSQTDIVKDIRELLHAKVK